LFVSTGTSHFKFEIKMKNKVMRNKENDDEKIFLSKDEMF
jgi:hypothetical protein